MATYIVLSKVKNRNDFYHRPGLCFLKSVFQGIGRTKLFTKQASIKEKFWMLAQKSSIFIAPFE